MPHLTPVPPHQRNRGSLDERLAGFSFADGLPSNAGKTTGGNGSRNNSATRLFFESESEEDDDDGEASSADSLQADEAHQKAEAEEEDLPLDCLKHVAKPLSSLAETIAFHRGRCGNAASRVEPLVFVGASSAKTPRSFRLGANRGQHAPRVSPVALSLGLFRHGAAERGAVDDTDDAEEAAMGKLHSKPKVAALITRRDVDGFVANVVCEAAVATELRCIYIHHTPMTFKHIARLTHGALAAMQPRFLKRLALRFCELDGVALAPLLAWLAVDHNGPAALHTLDLADNCISAKDLAVLAVAICGVPTLVHLSIRNNPLSLYYEEAQQRVNDEHREAVRLYNEHRQRKADDWAMLSGTAKWSAMGRGVAARRDSGFAGSFYDDGLPTSATMMMVRSPNIQPPPPPVNPELPPHQLIASFITALNQIEHLDLGFCGLGDTSVVKICNFLHDSDCRIKFLNLDGASMTITVSALLLDTIKRHCRSLLYVSLRYVFFCSGPQFQRKLCHTLRRRVWHALKESGEYDTIKEKEYRRRYRRETRITVGGGGDDGGGGSSGGSSPVPRLSRRTTIQPDGEDASYDDDDDAMECSASSGSDDGIEVGRTGGDAQNNDKNTQDNTTLPSVEIPCVHPPLAHLYHRLRSLERWCDVKLAYRAQASAQRETSQLVSSIGTVGSLGNLSQLRTSASFIGTRKHRRKKESRSTDDAMTPPLGVMQDHDDGCGGGEATASETTRSDDAATPQSSATDPSCHGPLNGQSPPPAAVGTPRPVVRWRLSEDGTDGSSGTPTPRRSVAHTGEGVCDEAGSDGGMGVSFLVSVPQPAAALNRVMSSGSNAGATDQAPVVQQHARAAERKQSLALPLPRERPHWKTFGSAERRSNNDDDDGDDSEYISSEEPTDDDAEVDQDSFAELDVEGDNVDEWGGWNLAGLRRGYGRYTTNSPSLAKRKRRSRGTKPG